MTTGVALSPFTVLADSPLSASALDPVTLRLYGGHLTLAPGSTVTNFVESVDGVIALPGGTSSGSTISGSNAADRFVMGLLRAHADVMLVGSGTLHASPGHHWTAEYVAPDFADSWRAIRRTLGIAERPRLAVVTASGEIDADHAALAEGAIILTTRRGAARLHVPATCSVEILDGEESVDLGAALARLQREGRGVVVSEAGPAVTGQLIGQGLLDEVFLTVSPVLAGSGPGAIAGFAAGVQFLPDRRIPAELRSLRSHGSYLFLRYAVRKDGS